MTLVDILQATLDEAVRCIGNTSCEYHASVVLGPPPEGCNMLTAYYASDRVRKRVGCSSAINTTIVVQLTRCCAHDAQDAFDWASELREANCFHRDWGQLVSCLTCRLSAVLEPWVTSCEEIEIEAAAPHEREGGCYSAYLYITYPHAPCCADYDPGP